MLRRFTAVLSASLIVILGAYVVLTAVSLSTTTPYLQAFDTIGTTATATLPVDFRADRTTTATAADMRKVGTFAAAGTATTQTGGANLGTSASNGIYNFGSGTTTAGSDRAIGFLASGTATASGNLYAQLSNNTGAPLTGLQISYDVEKYRNGSNAAGFRIQLFYSTDGTTWTNAGSDFLTAFAADANNSGFATAPGATVNVTNKTLSVAIPDTSTFYLAWNYSVSTGSTVTNAQALAVDNISITGVGGAGGDAAPSVTSTTPANAAMSVPVTSPIVINFSESVTASLSAFSVLCGGVPQAFSQSPSPATAYTLTPSSALPYATSCTVSVTANQISDTDTIDPPDGLASNVSFSFTTAAAPPPGAGIVMINEVDSDTPGSDSAEFIELYDGGVGNTPLDGLVVVLFDGGPTGSGNQSYAAFDLNGYSTNGQGYFVLGNPGVSGANLTFDPGPFGLLQNGPDAVALYIGHASDFPTGAVVTTANLQDAIVYGTDDPSASGLQPLLNAGQKIVNENATGNGDTQSSQRCPAGMGGFRNTSSYYPGAPTPGTANVCPAARPPSDVVISQIYGGGGNSGATYQNDFVELFNRGTAPADLTGWSLQYASSTGSGWDSNKQPLGGTIGAGEYYLIALASGGASGATLPAANISGLINMAAGSGKIALVGSFTGLVGNCPIFDPTIKDLVGYGSADCGEGSTTTSAGSNSTALFRKSNGSLDTDNNANDFALPTTPSPRRTAAIVELGPNVLTTDPRSNGFDAPRDATIQVTFTEPVDVDPGWFTLTCATSGSHNSATFAVGFGGQDHYITPNNNFTAGEQCTVTILKDRIHDQDLDDSGPNTDTLPADYSWSFTVSSGTAPPYPASVHLTMGMPASTGSDPSNYLMMKPEYAVSYNRDLGRPNWVSWHLSDEWIGTLTRVDSFRPDPQVPPDWYRVQSFDFSGSGFDRGHMTPNADRDKETSTPINQATFLMSNMVAQAPGNNQGPWASFEAYLRTLVEQQNDELYIVSGPYGTGGTGSNGGVTSTLADGHVTVPSSTWKVALVLPKGDDDLSRVSCSTRTIAVIMPNQDSIRNDDWQNYLTTVDAVEALTGYDFFSNLPEPYQRCIEAGTNGNNPPLVKGDQAITFAAPADSTYGAPPLTVFATGGASGNPVTFVASGACSSDSLNGATITIVAAGSCTVTASQAGNDIYNAATDVVRTFTINKAAAHIAVAGFSGTYDGSPHGATGSATGVSGEDLNGLLHVSDTFTNAPGGTAHWTFDGNVNYSAVSGDVAVVVAKATAAVTVNGFTGEYDGHPHGATGSAMGVVAEDLSSLLNLGASFVAVPGGTAHWTFAGNTNYIASSGDVSIVITDTIAPTVTITSPTSSSYTVGQVVLAGYACGDTESGVAACAGPVASGAAIDTSAVGTHTFTVMASDAAGNTATASVTYTVAAPTPGRMHGDGFLSGAPGDHDARQRFAFDVTTLSAGGSGARFGFWVVDPDGRPRRLDNFAATSISSIAFSDDPAFTPGRHAPPVVDTATFSGAGSLDGVSGYFFVVTATDQGEPGVHRDTFSLVVRDADGATVIDISGALAGGNIQSYRLPGRTPAPTILNAPANQGAVEASGPAGAQVTYGAASAVDATGAAIPVVCAPASGAVFPLGRTRGTCTATDAQGNSTTVGFFVVVVDTVPPTFVTPADISVDATGPGGATVTYSLPVVTDAVDTAVTVRCSPGSGRSFDFGATLVTCKATDDAGNAATTSFTVTVRDTIAPTITLSRPADGATYTVGQNVIVNYACADDGVGVTACVGTLADGAALDTNAAGTFTFVVHATDGAGNTATRTATYTVKARR